MLPAEQADLDSAGADCAQPSFGTPTADVLRDFNLAFEATLEDLARRHQLAPPAAMDLSMAVLGLQCAAHGLEVDLDAPVRRSLAYFARSFTHMEEQMQRRSRTTSIELV